MTGLSFLRDLSIVITLAAGAALVCQWLNQPRVIGYILAGLLISALSAWKPLLESPASIHILADLGLIFLMFSMGLDFNLGRLRQAGTSALGIAIVDATFMLWLGYMVGRALGWGWVESLFLGAIICDSSTTVLTKVLGEMGRRREPYAALMLGATVIEDMMAVVLLALLSGIGITGAVQPGLVAVRLGGLLVFLVVVVVGGLLVVPRLLNLAHRSRSDELLTVTVIGLCFGVAVMAIRLDLSLALGAFIMGAIMAETRQRLRIEVLTDPMRDVFGAVFFVAMGMLVDQRLLVAHTGLIALVTGVVLAGKFLASTGGTLLMGHPRGTAVKVGCGMAQVNEFALIIAGLGISLGATRPFLYPVAVAVSLLTTFLNPYLLRRMDGISRVTETLLPGRARMALDAYARWAGRIERRDTSDAVRRGVRRSLIIIGINLGWIAAAFILAEALAKRAPGLLGFIPPALGGAHTGFWLAAALFVAPFLVATLRKLQALGMILAELKFPAPGEAGRPSAPRLLTEMAVLGVGSALLAVYMLMLGSAILPPWPVLIGLLAVLAVMTRLLWAFHVRLYARAQTALRDALEGAQEWFSQHPISAMPYFFRDARIGTVRVGDGSRVLGRALRDLDLRGETGATIIGIERGAQPIVNPDAAEIIRPGDRLMLLGTPDQIGKARDWLQAGDAGAG